MANQSQPGSSPFARYSGEQINQIPEGYVQAMAANPFASLIGNALSAYQTQKKMQLDSETNLVQSRKIGAEEKKNAIAEQKLAQDEAKAKSEEARKNKEDTRKANLELLGLTQKLHQEADNNWQRLNVALEQDNAETDPKKKLEKSKRAELEKGLLEAEQTKGTLFKKMLTLTSSFEDEVKGQGPTLNIPNELKPGPNFDITGQGGVNLPNGDFNGQFVGPIGSAQGPTINWPYTRPSGFNQASSPQGQGNGGKGEVGPQGEAGVAGIETPAPTPNVTNQVFPEPTSKERQIGSANTPANTSLNEKGEIVDKGDFQGFTITRKKEVKSASGQVIPASISITPKLDDKGKPTGDITSVGIETGEGFDSETSQKRVRQAHILKFIIDNGLDETITPSPEERRLAEQAFVTKENSAFSGRIMSAYALMLRNTEGDPEAGGLGGTALQSLFLDKLKTTTGDYMATGAPDLEKLAMNPVTGNNAQALSTGSRDLIDKLNKSISFDYVGKTSPYSGQLDLISRQLEAEARIQNAAIGNESALAASNARVKTIEAKRLAIQSQQAEWERQQEVQKKFNDQMLEINQRLIAEQAKIAEANVAIEKGTLETSGTKGEARARFGASGLTNYAQLHALGGFQSIAGESLPPQYSYRKIPIPGTNRLAIDRMDMAEFVHWGLINNPNAVVEMSKLLPDKEKIAAAEKLQSRVNRLSEPLNKLYSAFEYLNGKATTTKNLQTGKLMIQPGSTAWVTAYEQSTNKVLTAAALDRAKLVAEFRVELIGPGNPSNFEQEIVRDVIPDVTQWLSKTSHGEAKLRNLTALVISSHVSSMRENGFKPTEETVKQLNERFGHIMGRKLTMEDIDKMQAAMINIRSQYAGSSYVPGKKYAVENAKMGAWNAWEGVVNSMFETRNKQTK